MERITSKQNQKIKDLKKLYTHKGRKKEQAYLIESWHLVQEAINYLPKDDIIGIYATDDQYLVHSSELSKYSLTIISGEVAQDLSDTSTTQGIFAVCKIVTTKLNNDDLNGSWLLLDNVQDPGNIGTMVRTADAAGFAGVIFGEGTSSPHNSKVLRSMQGSQFHIKVIKHDLNEIIINFNERNIPIFGSELNKNAVNYQDIEPQTNFALIMGNEGNGMNKELLTKTTKNLYIPINGKAESLNVAIAAAVIMFRIKK